MKNISLALNAILIIAVAILYYLQFSADNTSDIKEDEVEVIEEPAEEPVEKIESIVGYLDMDSLQVNYKLYAELINKLKSRQIKYDKELNSKTIALKKKFQDFQQQAPKMTQFEGENRQRELMQEEQNLYKLQDDFAAKFQKEQAKLDNEFQTTISDYVAKYNEDSKYHIIIGASPLGNRVLYFNEGIDITKNIVEGLNEEYDKENAPKEDK